MLKHREGDLLKLIVIICRYLRGDVPVSHIDPGSFTDKVMRQRTAFIRALIEKLEEGTLYTTYKEVAKRANNYLSSNEQIPLKGGALARIGGDALGIASTASMCCKGFLISAVVGSSTSGGKKPSQGFFQMIANFGFPFSNLKDEQKKVHDFFKNKK